MSLHSTYNEKEPHQPAPRFNRFPTSAIFEVGNAPNQGTSSATGAAYEPLEFPRQQLFPTTFWMNQSATEGTGAATVEQSLERKGFSNRRCWVAGEAPKCSSAGDGYL